MAGSCYLSDSSVPALQLTVTVINVPGFQGMSMQAQAVDTRLPFSTHDLVQLHCVNVDKTYM